MRGFPMPNGQQAWPSAPFLMSTPQAGLQVSANNTSPRVMSNNAFGSLAGELNNQAYAAVAVGLLAGVAIGAGWLNAQVNLRVGK